MSLQVMIVNSKRYLIQSDSLTVDSFCESILSQHPSDALVEFDTVKEQDLKINLKFN